MHKHSLFAVSFLVLTLCPFSDAARLGDLPDEKPKQDQEKKKQPDEESYTPEEKKQLVTELSDDYYRKGVAALRQDNLRMAKSYFEKVLALSPNHARAREHLNEVTKKLIAQRKPPVPAPSVEPGKQLESKPKVVKKTPSQKTLSPEESRKKMELDKQQSDELYFQALTASQSKEKDKAVTLCQQALRLNPANLQAKRMLDRLSQ